MSFATYARRVRDARCLSGIDLAILDTVSSTNDLAKRLVREYQQDNRDAVSMDLLAWRQTQGRGRGEHRWSSPGGCGVWATMIRPLERRSRFQLLPLAVGVGLCRALNPWTEGTCRLSWPNDLMVAERKLGGILVEGIVTGERSAAVIGFGINHHPDLGRFNAPNPASICHRASDPPSLADVAVACLEAVDETLASDREPLVTAYRQCIEHTAGEALRCRTAEGTIEGRFAGVDDQGFLKLTTDNGLRTLAAAELIRQDGPIATGEAQG